jgi:hypothetical protein
VDNLYSEVWASFIISETIIAGRIDCHFASETPMSGLNPNKEYIEALAQERKKGLSERELALISTEHDNQDQTWMDIVKETLIEYYEWASASIIIWILLAVIIMGGLLVYSVSNVGDVRSKQLQEINNWEQNPTARQNDPQ